MKAKDENKEEKEIVTPFDNSNNFAEDVSEVTSVNHTVKPSISSEISSENGSVLNESSIDEGLFVGGVETPIPVPVIEEKPVEMITLFIDEESLKLKTINTQQLGKGRIRTKKLEGPI